MASHKFTMFKDLFDLCYENGVFAIVQSDPTIDRIAITIKKNNLGSTKEITQSEYRDLISTDPLYISLYSWIEDFINQSEEKKIMDNVWFFCFDQPQDKDLALLLVGKRFSNKKEIEVVNAFKGQEAIDLFQKLTTPTKITTGEEPPIGGEKIMDNVWFFCFDQPQDKDLALLLVVIKRFSNKKEIEVVNDFKGQEAIDLFQKLTTTTKITTGEEPL